MSSQARLFYGLTSSVANNFKIPTETSRNVDLLRRYSHVDITPLNQSGPFLYGNTSDDVGMWEFDICPPGTGEEQKLSLG
jgi:hypothetical protein